MEPQFKKQPKGFATKAIHAGQNPLQWKSMSIVPQISLSTTFKQHGPGEHEVSVGNTSMDSIIFNIIQVYKFPKVMKIEESVM